MIFPVLTAALILALSAPALSAEAPAVQASASAAKAGPSLWDWAKVLSGKKFVDLTHAFHPGIPRWAGYPDEKRKILYDYRKQGFRAERYSFAGPWGTHADAPSHFHPGLKTLETIPVKDMVAPLVVLDISAKAAQNPDAEAGVEDVQAWEARHGRIPPGAFVALRTDWSKRWPDADALQNRDDRNRPHYPGWSLDALKFLVEDRNILAIGHETADTDPGILVAEDRYPAGAYIFGQDRYQIELMTNLDQVPESGALIVAAFPKPEEGTSFPARVFAILP